MALIGGCSLEGIWGILGAWGERGEREGRGEERRGLNVARNSWRLISAVWEWLLVKGD